MSAPTHAPLQTAKNAALDPEKLEVAPGTRRESVEGWVPTLASDEEIRAALEKAFDYRGDVTITRKDGSKVEGYLFDRGTGAALEASFVRLLPKDSNQRVRLSYAQIAALAFSGSNHAAGISGEAWVRNPRSKKSTAEGEASLEPEALE